MSVSSSKDAQELTIDIQNLFIYKIQKNWQHFLESNEKDILKESLFQKH